MKIASNNNSKEYYKLMLSKMEQVSNDPWKNRSSFFMWITKLPHGSASSTTLFKLLREEAKPSQVEHYNLILPFVFFLF